MDRFLEFGEDGFVVAESVDGGFLLNAALFLDTAELFVFAFGLDGFASGGVFQLVGNVHHVAENRAFLGSGQIGFLVSGQGSAHSAQTSAVDGRGIDVDFIRVANDADHVRYRFEIDESIDGAADLAHDFLFGISDDEVLVDRELDIVNLHLLRGGEEFDLLLVQVDGDDLQQKYI